MAESPLNPSSILGNTWLQTMEFPTLQRRPTDTFYHFKDRRSYENTIKDGLEKSNISKGLREYLISLLKFQENPSAVKENFMKYKGEINTKEVAKDFGEVLGPLYITRLRHGRILFPIRANYELFDFFVEDNTHTHGFSSKAMGTPSNTLAPYLIIDNLAKMDSKKLTSPKEKHVLEVLRILASSSTLGGPLEAVKYLVRNNIAPSEVDPKIMKDLKAFIQKQDIELFCSYIDQKVLPRLSSVPAMEKKKYLERKKPYSDHNIAYASISYIERAGKEGKLDPTKLIQKALPQLNILKMGVTREGLPQFELGSVFSHSKYNFRSKARWDKVKDKLGVQL